MKKIILISVLVITLVRCKSKDPVLICLNQSTNEGFARSIESLENKLFTCQLVKDNSLSSFSSLVKRSAEERDRIKNCLNSYEAELPSLSDISLLENCCRSLDKNNEYCSIIIKMSEEGVSESALSTILNAIKNKNWNDNVELRGTIEFLYYYMMTKDKVSRLEVNEKN